MKVKTSELSGMALCYAVCMIEMPHLVWNKTIGIHHASDQIVVPELPEPKCYSPFTGWAMFGPIIEREKIKVFPNVGGTWSAQIRHTESHHLVSHPVLAGWTNSSGPTPLIAAMRCLCCAKLGNTVDVPEELCK